MPPSPRYLKRDAFEDGEVRVSWGIDTRTEEQPPMAVVLHNDDINGFDYVVRALRAVFGFGMWRAGWLTLRTHVGGSCRIWVGPRPDAENRARALVGMGPDPNMLHRGAQPLRVTIETAK